jgi:hypothetical protein
MTGRRKTLVFIPLVPSMLCALFVLSGLGSNRGLEQGGKVRGLHRPIVSALDLPEAGSRSQVSERSAPAGSPIASNPLPKPMEAPSSLTAEQKTNLEAVVQRILTSKQVPADWSRPLSPAEMLFVGQLLSARSSENGRISHE